MALGKVAASAVKICRVGLKGKKASAKFIRSLANDTSNIMKKKKVVDDVIKIKTKSGKILKLEITPANEADMQKVLNSFANRMNLNSKPLLKSEINELRNFNAKITENAMFNISKHMKGKSISSLTENYVGKKERLIQEYAKIDNPKLLERLKMAKNPEQMTQILLQEEYAGFLKFDKIVSKSGLKHSTLEVEQLANSTVASRTKFIMAREKAMYVPSTNPQVIAIENILKEQYGAKLVSLKDDVNMAKEVLKAYEIAAKNGVKLPKNVIVSDFMFANGEHLKDTILLASRQSRIMSMDISQHALKGLPGEQLSNFQKNFMRLPNRNQFSTSSDYHVPLHEIMHGEHSSLAAFSMKKIPARYESAKNNVSAYSALSGTHETFTELNTKRLIDGLNPQEQELYNYLNILS